MRSLMLTCLLFPGLIQAQQDPGSLDERLVRLRQKLQSRQVDEQRLIDLRVRHDMGLSVQGDHYFMLPANDPALPNDQARELLQKEETEVLSLMDRLQRLRAELDLVRQRTPPMSAVEMEQTWFPVPQPGSRPGELVADPDIEQLTHPVQPLEPVAPFQGARDPGIPGVISGTTNRSAIGGSLYRLAASLLRRARKFREDGLPEEARADDQRAYARLEFALKELEPLVSVDEPAFVDLFYQGKCLEELFYLDSRYRGLTGPDRSKEYAQRYEEIRQPFLRIMAADQGSAVDSQSLGSWGQSAQTALRVIRWVGDFGDYKPTIPINSIQWIRK